MPIKSQSVEIGSLVHDIRDKKLLLPELQRRYVWKSTQVRDLFDSLYHQYPSGQLLVWQTDDMDFARAASIEAAQGTAQYFTQPLLLLDGQQRLTSLAAILNDTSLVLRGAKRSIDVVFNVHTEKFEVAGPRNRGDKNWISLRKLFSAGVATLILEHQSATGVPVSKEVFERLMRLDAIRTYRYNVSVLEQMSYDEVTHIFVRINSGGTTLGSADLTLAQISSRWRGVTEDLDIFFRAMKRRSGDEIELDTGILIRTLSVMLSSRTRLNELFTGTRRDLTADELKAGWVRVKLGVQNAIDFLRHNCKIDRLSLLPTQYVLIPLAAYFDRFENLSPEQSRDLQRWVYMALIWSRYSGTSESSVDQDVAALSTPEPIAGMIRNIEDAVGRRPVTERELQNQRKNSPYMLMAYVLARYANAEDWFNGVQVGSGQLLEFHHIFPKDVLRDKYDLKAEARLIDQVANLAFLSQRANSRIRNKLPADYLPDIPKERLKAQSVPTDSALWTLETYETFVLERRKLLAMRINELLNTLSGQGRLWSAAPQEMLEARVNAIEHQMRDLIADCLVEARGAQAEELLPGDIRRGLKNRAAEYVQRNPSEAHKYDELAERLRLAQFSDYAKIILANWSLFQSVFGDEANFGRHNQAVVKARNAFAHNDSLSPADLMLAEAGLTWLEDSLSAALQLQEDAEDDEQDEEADSVAA